MTHGQRWMLLGRCGKQVSFLKYLALDADEKLGPYSAVRGLSPLSSDEIKPPHCRKQTLHFPPPGLLRMF